MVKKVFFPIIVLVIMSVVLAWNSIRPRHNLHDSTLPESEVMDTMKIEEIKKAEASDLAKRYIEGIPEGVVLLDETDESIQEEIELWESRILDFAKNRQQKNLDQNNVRNLANQTVSLFHLLKEASNRRDSGLTPYTSMSGFNTMTLVMKMEKSFKDVCDFSFSEFMFSQDAEVIKALARN